MLWLRLQAKLFPYKLAWLLVVSFSIIYTLRGLQAIFPGEVLFHFGKEAVTESHLLGIALCLGQYTMLSISFGLFRSENKLKSADKLMACAGLAVGILLTISNTTFAFKAINMSKDDSIVQIETLKAEVATIDKQILAKNSQISGYENQLKLIPSAHSSNIIKMMGDIQQYTTPLRTQVAELQSQQYTKNAKIAELQGKAETNRNFSLSGMDGSKLIAMVMSLALDPIAIMIMLSMQSLTAQYWKEVKTVNPNAPIKLGKIKHLLKKSAANTPGGGYQPESPIAEVKPIRPIRAVQMVDNDPPEADVDEIDTIQIAMPPKRP